MDAGDHEAAPRELKAILKLIREQNGFHPSGLDCEAIRLFQLSRKSGSGVIKTREYKSLRARATGK